MRVLVLAIAIVVGIITAATASQNVYPALTRETLVGTWETVCGIGQIPVVFHIVVNASDSDSYLAEIYPDSMQGRTYRLDVCKITDEKVYLEFREVVPIDQWASVWWIGIEAALVLIFLWGIEGLAVAMLPMRFLDGRKVIEWNRVVWAALMFLGLFSTIHILLTPSSGYVGHTTGQISVGVVVLSLIFGAISVGLWSYFRYRPERLIPSRAR